MATRSLATIHFRFSVRVMAGTRHMLVLESLSLTALYNF